MITCLGGNPGIEITSYSSYSTRRIDGHYILEKRQSGERWPTEAIGVRHTMQEADSRLIEISREDFMEKRRKIKNPTPEEAESLRKSGERAERVKKIETINQKHR